jgi:ABC-2 type transport system ATP-binding protein
MSDAVIALQDVTKRYDDVLAVNAVSFGIRQGSICALLGGNGAGKTILLSMLLGLLLPSSGRLYGLKNVKQQITALARQLDIGDFLGRDYGSLSAGQKTRVAASGCLVSAGQPRVRGDACGDV